MFSQWYFTNIVNKHQGVQFVAMTVDEIRQKNLRIYL